MRYTEVMPSADLRPWVERYWIREAAAGPVTLSILPDGCADLILDLSGSESAFAVGTMTRPLEINQQAMPEYFGIRFRPGRAALFFRENLAAITDARVTLRDLGADPLSSLPERTAFTPRDRRVALIDDFLRRRLAAASPDRRVDAAVGAIVRTSGRIAVSDAARRAGVTRQHLGRLFDVHVGVSPKTFARIIRFRSAMKLGRIRPWADVAATLGYADQSHLISDFREFAGATPVPFFLSRPAAAPLR